MKGVLSWPTRTQKAKSRYLGSEQIKEVTKKLYLKDFNHHSKAVYGLDFVPATSYLVAGGDDMSISYLDFSIGKVCNKFSKVHSDFIRTMQAFTSNQGLMLSASYDKLAKVWDVRDSKPEKFVFKHEAEIEDAKIYNSDTSLVTVGGRFVGQAY